MPEREALQSQFAITLNSEPASGELMRHLEQVTVETSLHLPDVATLVLHDPALEWIDHASLAPGIALKVAVEAGAGEATIFDGEIVELEPEFGATQRLTVRAFDRLHRLARGTHVRSFINVGDDELVRQIASEVGLSAEIRPAPREIYQYVLQANETNLAFLQRRAAALGYLLYVEGNTLCCVTPESQRQTIELAWGDTLYEFRPRLSTIGQVSKTIVRGWDPGTKREVLGEARSSSVAPTIGIERDGGAVAQHAFQLEAQDQLADRPVRTQAAAEQLAQAATDRTSSQFVVADGLCGGNATLVAGSQVNIRGVGERFSGAYFVTTATHSTSPHQPYTTHFSISGLQRLTLLSLLEPEHEPGPTAGLAVGVVTDNADPEHLGRVKVQFPWLSPEHTSDWARVISVGGGSSRGIQFQPEINDEVLIGFEQGDIHHPYVLGGLWNGLDLPPDNAAVRDGRVERRTLRTRAGHELTFDDSERDGCILIKDKHGHQIKLDTANESLTIEAQGELQISASGDITISGKNVMITGKSNVDVQANEINLN